MAAEEIFIRGKTYIFPSIILSSTDALEIKDENSLLFLLLGKKGPVWRQQIKMRFWLLIVIIQHIHSLQREI